jgi:predicted aminopeptidase
LAKKYGIPIVVIALLATQFLSGCSIGYIAESAYYQLKLLNNREDLDDVLKNKELSEETRQKLLLAKDVQKYSVDILGLKKSDNYSTFVDLGRPYVTYVVSASPKNKLEHYTWWFPIVGSVPYKGYFYPEGAKEEKNNLLEDNLDVYVRGVTAYSTLGWFNDPLLSSMIRYSNYSLANVIIHENVHATIYISSSAGFNERLATYIGDVGAELYFKSKEGQESPTLAEMKNKNLDSKLFSKFISGEIKALKKWYQDREGQEIQEEERQERFNSIKETFYRDWYPKMKSKRYENFKKVKLNNARLMQYKLYVSDLSDFEKIYEKLGRDIKKLISYAKDLEKSENPEKKLKEDITEVSKDST